MFVSHLAQDGLSHPTIKVYLSAIRNLHVSAGLHTQFELVLTPRLEMVMKGIKKEKSLTAPRTRLPITLDIMADIKKRLSDSPHKHDNIML